MNTIQMYDAQADTIKIEDITTDDTNRVILHRIKRNSGDDDYNHVLHIQNHHDDYDKHCIDYVPEGAKDMGWLGYFVGKNNHLKELELFNNIDIDVLEPFIRGLNNNKSICKFNFYYIDLSGGQIFTMMGQFFKNNSIGVIYMEECVIGVEGARLLALAIGSFNSLTELSLIHANIADEGLVNIITSLSMHPNMKSLDLDGNQLQTNGCKALSTLLKCSCTKVEKLDLRSNEINDEGIDALVPVFKNYNNLQKLWLDNHISVTSRGWQKLASILASPNSKLKELHMSNSSIDDEAAAAFASSLVNNSSLSRLELYGIQLITEKGWGALSGLLCDTSSVKSTFLSNHTLQNVVGKPKDAFRRLDSLGTVHQCLLSLNRRYIKKEVAMIKIIQHHNDINMMPFFEWEFKVLPLMIGWFERASTIEMPKDYEANIGPRKLSSIYQFVRGMPDLYVETRLRQELEEIKAARLQMEERERGILERLGRK